MADQENGIALAAMPRVSADISDFAAAWRGWRGGNVVPVRDQLNLDDIQKLLSRVLVMEVWSPSETLVRLAGTTYLELFGIDLTGHNYVDMAPPQDRELRGRRLWAMANQPCGSHAVLPHPNPNKRGADIHVLILPVQPSDKTQPMQLFGVSASSAERVTPLDGADVGMVERLVDRFSFVDIGAGLPDEF